MDKIILFGASKLGEKAYDILKNEYVIIYFCDNDKNKWGNKFCGVEVINPQMLGKYSDVKVIIASMYYKEIYAQLTQNNIKNVYILEEKNMFSYMETLEKAEIYVKGEKIDILNILNNTQNINLEKVSSEYLNKIENQEIDGLSIEDIYIYDDIVPYAFFRGYYYEIMFKVIYYILFINELIATYKNEIFIKIEDQVFFDLIKQVTNIKCELKSSFILSKMDYDYMKLEDVKKVSNLNFKEIIKQKNNMKDNFLVISDVERIRYMLENKYEKKQYDFFYGNILEKMKEKFNVIYLRRLKNISEMKLNKFFEYSDKCIVENTVDQYINDRINSEVVINKELLKINKGLLDKIDFVFNGFDLKNIFRKYIINIDNFQFCIKRTLAIEKFIDEFSIKGVIAVDEYDCREIIVACNRLNVPVYALQHGFYSQYHCQFFYSKYEKVLAPKKTFLWGNIYKKMFIQNSNIFNENNLCVSGQPINDLNVNYIREDTISNEEIIRITYVSIAEYDMDKEALLIILDALSLFQKKCKLIIRLHPLDTNYDLYRELIVRYKICNYKIDQDGDLYEIVNDSDLVIGICSTVLIESLIFNKKIATIITKQYGDYNDWVKDRISTAIKSKEDLLYILNNFSLTFNDKEQIKEIVQEYFYKIDGKVCERILREI